MAIMMQIQNSYVNVKIVASSNTTPFISLLYTKSKGDHRTSVLKKKPNPTKLIGFKIIGSFKNVQFLSKNIFKNIISRCKFTHKTDTNYLINNLCKSLECSIQHSDYKSSWNWIFKLKCLLLKYWSTPFAMKT